MSSRLPLRFGESTLLVALLLILAVDFGWPLVSGLSLALLAAMTALSLPWAAFVLRAERGSGAVQHRLKVWLFRIVVLALAGVFIGAKWWLWLGPGMVEPERFAGSSRSYVVALFIVLPLGALGAGLRLARFVGQIQDHPARLMALSFGAVGLFGGFLLSLPISMQRVSELSFVDNVFMSFSAVCVTGLSVNVLSETYTLFGQAVLCGLIQVGGLGIMVLSAAIGILAGQRLRVKSTAVLAEIVDAESIAGLRRVVLAIVGTTLVIEAMGAALLYTSFSGIPELSASTGAPLAGPSHPVWAAVFHAVSGFCNAGFSNFQAGLVPLVGSPVVMLTMTCLIVLGGIGFPVIHELTRRFGRFALRRPRERVTLNTRIALRATAILLAAVTVVYFALEWRASFANLTWFERALAALFQSASSRTAGFNVVDVGSMLPASLMLTCVAMFIGGCPGSCAGGIKTTTFAVLFAGLRAELQGRPARLLDRALLPATIRKAIGVAFLSIGIVSVALFLLLLVEPHAPLELAFEVFSAFSTTGLSTGVTPRLSMPGKLLIILTMYIGRIGPLTLALAVSARSEPAKVQLPSERVLIG